MGYLFVIILSLVVIGALIVGLTGMSSRKIASGTLPSKDPVVRTKPSADEANPASSITATSEQKENAQRHTPPA